MKRISFNPARLPVSYKILSIDTVPVQGYPRCSFLLDRTAYWGNILYHPFPHWWLSELSSLSPRPPSTLPLDRRPFGYFLVPTCEISPFFLDICSVKSLRNVDSLTNRLSRNIAWVKILNLYFELECEFSRSNVLARVGCELVLPLAFTLVTRGQVDWTYAILGWKLSN